MKTCSKQEKCIHPSGPMLSTSEFHKDTRAADGLRGACKVCTRADNNSRSALHRREANDRGKLYYAHNKSSIAAKARARYTKNKARICALRKEYYAANKEVINARNRAAAIANAPKIKRYQQAYRRNNADRIYSKWQELNPGKCSKLKEQCFFAAKVYANYSWKCVICGNGDELRAHHAISRVTLPPKDQYNTRIGVCLCHAHHNLFHKVYGRGNNTRTQLDEFIIDELFKREQQEVAA